MSRTGPSTPVEVLAGDDLGDDALAHVGRHVVLAIFLIAGRLHLFSFGQVHPQLETAHQPVFLLGRFRVDDAARRRHPLHAARLDHAFMALVVAVAHAPGDHVGHGFKAAMGVGREAGDIVARIVRVEFVEHQEGVERACSSGVPRRRVSFTPAPSLVGVPRVICAMARSDMAASKVLIRI
jgi:hypothetical protein